jgi:RNA polymerase sigma-70 factor (ECF subfamily)
VEGAGVGTPSTIERLYREEGRKLWWALLAYAGDREVASDAVAEAFAQALARGDAIADPRAWVWRTAFRVAAGELQRRRRIDPELPDLPDPSQPQAYELVSILRELPGKQRAAIVMRYYADRPVSDVAAALGVSQATARVHLHRGRRRLKRLLEDSDG